MTTTTPTPVGRERTTPVRLLDVGPPDCECTHDGVPCSDEASVRVTLVCAAEGCDCAAAVYLLCAPCLRVWRRRARRERTTLRVVPL